ncbi:unannotated protein [freshwater metagenome]|uniref:Unannotated protein n=1 Tax=freshwater metagenome TaxID=449393 RepID=A0A6J7DYJ6_9ZZZZ|nr:hypothetical protein [Actinomycetota bacterium]
MHDRLRHGLCADCAHQRIVLSGRGSVFSLCERGLSDRAYAKYPRIPVIRCAGFDERSDDDGTPG